MLLGVIVATMGLARRQAKLDVQTQLNKYGFIS